MKMRNFVIGAALAAAMVVGLASSNQKVQAASPGDTATCKFIYEEGLGKGFTRGFNSNGDPIVSVNVIVSGNAFCRKDFVLASFKIPHATLQPYPVDEQVLFRQTILRNLEPGKYKMSVEVPDCFHQVDLALGTVAADADGHPFFPPNRLLNAYLGGTKRCVEPPVTPPEKPERPVRVIREVKTVVTKQPESLPKTGFGEAAGIFASVTAAGAVAHRYILGRRR